MTNFVDIAQTAAEIWPFYDFQDGSVDLQNFKFLTVKRFEMHHHAKLRQNRLNRCRDMAIFRFFKMAAAAILDFRNFKFLMVGTINRVKLHHRAKFRQNRSNRG